MRLCGQVDLFGEMKQEPVLPAQQLGLNLAPQAGVMERKKLISARDGSLRIQDAPVRPGTKKPGTQGRLL